MPPGMIRCATHLIYLRLGSSARLNDHGHTEVLQALCRRSGYPDNPLPSRVRIAFSSEVSQYAVLCLPEIPVNTRWFDPYHSTAIFEVVFPTSSYHDTQEWI